MSMTAEIVPIPSIEIEHDIPIPPPASGAQRGPYWTLAQQMVFGDSVVLSNAAANSLASVLRKSGFAVVMRSVDGKKRVWKQERREIGNGRDDAEERPARAAKKRPRHQTKDAGTACRVEG
jgi:hypothetical protein